MINSENNACASYHQWSRRALLKGALTGAAAMVFGPSALAQITLRQNSEEKNSLIVVFLRGGADGLNVIVPYGEDAYHRIRPSIKINSPKIGIKSERALDLNGFFGFHPALSSIESLFHDGELAAIHAIGSGDQSRSHFEAMAAMERGINQSGPGTSRTNGWLARYLNATATEQDSPVRALAISDLMPDSLRGAPGALNISEIGQYRLDGSADFRAAITKSYATGEDTMTHAGRETLQLLNTLDRLDYKKYSPNVKAKYPDSGLGQGLRQVAFLLKARAGLEVAFLDQGGFDTHVVQGGSTGWLANLLTDLGQSLRALNDDLGEIMGRTTVVVMTEFGRRAYENGGLGTDHGRASFMLTLGGGVKGGKVYSDWPGLEKHQLVGPGDLKVTTDYRSVLAEILNVKMGVTDTNIIFPGIPNDQISLYN